MEFADFCKIVNELETERCASIKRGLFAAVAVGYPDSMLRHYYDHNFSPAETVQAIVANAD